MKRHHWGLSVACLATIVAASCSEGASGDACTPGEYRCSLNTLTKCEGGVWLDVKVCASNETCNAATLRCESGTACSENSRRCGDARNAVEICKNGEWQVETTCSNGTLCDASKLSCEADTTTDLSCSVNGSAQCKDNALYECRSNQWTLARSCTTEETCNATTKTCDSKSDPNDKPGKECENNAFKCEGSTLYECRSEHWVHINSCIPGKEVCSAEMGSCELDSQHCIEGHETCSADGSAVVVCTDGAYVQKEKCPVGKACLGNTCVATTQCDASTKDACDGNKKIQCLNGALITQDCADKVCVVRNDNAICEAYICDDGAIDCKDSGTKRLCTNNAWIDTACRANEEVCIGGACVKRTCNEGAKRCANNAVEVCKNNAWIVEKACAAQMCKDNACVDVVCSSGDMRCSQKRVETCSDNAYTLTKTCGNEEVCMQDGTQADCKPLVCTENARQCANNKVQICRDNAWVDDQDCGDRVCDVSTQACRERECSDGEKKCSVGGKTVRVCQNGLWTNGENCSQMKPAQVCKENSDTASCKPEEQAECIDGSSCSGNELVICIDGKIVSKTDCATQTNPGVCKSSNGASSCVPYECTGNGFKCENNVLKQCNDSTKKYETKQVCTIGLQACNEKEGVCDTYECTGDGFICDGNTLKKCFNHKYDTVQTCDPETTTCDASARQCTKNDCKAGEYSCSGKTLRDCQNNKWHTVKTCTSQQECDSAQKDCIDHECEGNAFVCDQKQLKQCQNYKLVDVKLCTPTQECDDKQGKCVDHECEYKEKHAYCDGQTPKVCENYMITSGKPCNADQICDNTQGKCISRNCAEGSYMCATGNKLMKCEGNAWVLKTACLATEKCDSDLKACVLTPVCTPNDMRCDSNNLQKCDAAGQWANEETCRENQLCVSVSSKEANCVDKWEHPEWCIFQAIDKYGRGYGRILIPKSVESSKITAQYVCGSPVQPVSTWTHVGDGIINTKCNNCGANTEFMAPSLPLPTGTYACAFSYIWGPETIYCSTTNDSHDEIVKTDTLVLDSKYTKELNVRTIGDSETISWCRGGAVKVNDNAYIQLLLPDNTRASQAKVEVICGDKAKLPSTWTTKFATYENLVCNNCGANVEYMTDKISPTSGEVCASFVTFGMKTYACPIAGGAPTEFNASTELNDAFLSTVSE